MNSSQTGFPVNALDTIAAIASPPGRGAVGIVRVSGSRVPALAAALLGRLPAARTAVLAAFKDAAGEPLDRGLALYFPGPHSFTGEDVLELQGHGGSVVLDLVLRRLLDLGCRLARPGEFSERAFLNGKMDIAQAEAIADLIDAGTTAAARAAVRSLQGEFSSRVVELQSQVTGLRAYVEAAIDFPDEEIDFLSDAALSGRLGELVEGFERLSAAARRGAMLRDGLTVVIAGAPNAGKSSLLNRLVGDEVAIVTAHPGTTRDLLRHSVHLDGMPLNLIDTAGLRDASDVVEAEGIRRALLEIQRADRVLYVIDAAQPGNSEAAAFARDTVPDPRRLAPDLARLAPDVPVTWVFNKIDLAGLDAAVSPGAEAPGAEAPDVVTLGARDANAAALASKTSCIRLSAKSGQGLVLLREHLKAVAGYADPHAGVFSARRRHLDALDRARRHVDEASLSLRAGRGYELFAEEMRLAQRNLGEITGEFTSEDLLSEIFSGFCIGK